MRKRWNIWEACHEEVYSIQCNDSLEEVTMQRMAEFYLFHTSREIVVSKALVM